MRVTKWEYRIEKISIFHEEIEEALNSLGEVGWEVCCLLGKTGTYELKQYVLLKRPLVEPQEEGTIY